MIEERRGGRKKRKIPRIIVVIVFLAICWGVAAVTVPIWTNGNSAYVYTPSANIEAYRDEACTQPLKKIDYGAITEGSWNNKTFWVKNEGVEVGYVEWCDDIEVLDTYDSRDYLYKEYDHSFMYCYNETTRSWEWWYENQGLGLPIATLYLEPGEKVKVRYSITFGISKPLVIPPLALVNHTWILELG